MNVLVDSWAWIEAFSQTPKSAAAREELEKGNLLTSTLALAEVAWWCSRNGKDPKPYLNAIKENATILGVEPEVAEMAGNQLLRLRKAAPGIGMVDAIIYLTARAENLPFLTGDPHFRNLPGVEFIE